jgi:hypothetical protein
MLVQWEKSVFKVKDADLDTVTHKLGNPKFSHLHLLLPSLTK